MEQRLFRLAWAVAVLVLIGGLIHCKKLQDEWDWTLEKTKWGSPADIIPG